MKRRAILPFLLLPGLLMAQPVIDQSDMPAAGDALNRTQAVPDPSLDLATTGPAQTWDFSDLAAIGGDATPYFSVASTGFIYALAFSDQPNNPNRSNHARSGTDIPFFELLPITDPYTFFYRSASAYKKTGYGATVNGLTVPIPLQQHDVIYNLPLAYGDADAGFSAYALNVPSLVYYGYAQQRTNEVDGWGAITIPAGTFEVLRVKTTIQGRDSVRVDTLDVGFTIVRPLVREYKWLAHGYKTPILQVNTVELFGAEIITEVYFYDEPRTIVVAPPVPTTICPGTTFTLNYATTGTFNTGGFFLPPNVFTAQLSDATGDFANAVTIGTLTAAASGSIEVTIPLGTPLGTGYRIRVIANSPATTGADNGVDIVVGGAPPVASVSADGPTTFCAGGTVVLTAEPAGMAYQWFLGGQPIPGATAATLEVDASGDHAVEVMNGCGSDLSDAITVAVEALPEHTLPDGPLLSCDGTPVEIVAEDQSGQPGLVYQWSIDGQPIDGADASAVVAATTGAYTLAVTRPATGCVFNSPAVEVVIEDPAAPQVTADGPLAFCEGGAVTLTSDVVQGASYQWSLDGDAIAGAEQGSLLANASGSYSVVTISPSGCASPAAAALVVEVVPVPVAPDVQVAGDPVFCAGGSVLLYTPEVAGATYQWSADGAPIAGEQNDSLEVTLSGLYSVAITVGPGCAAASAAEVEVVANPLPEQPVITQSTDSLLATGSGTFQWFLSGVAIDGATEAFLVPVESGSYTAVITDANGCSSSSEPYVYISTGMDAGEVVDLRLFPNPTSGALFLQVPHRFVGHGAAYRIADGTGCVVLTGRVDRSDTAIDVRLLAAGAYLLQVIDAQGAMRVVRFVRN